MKRILVIWLLMCLLLTIPGHTADAVTLAWDAMPEGDGWAGVRVYDITTGSYVLAATVDELVTTAVISGLSPGNHRYIARSFIANYTSGTGTHNGSANNAALVDTTHNFVTDGVVVGATVSNSTDGSSGTVTAITTTTNANDTLEMTLTGGTDNDWDVDDAYTVGISAESADSNYVDLYSSSSRIRIRR
jgi:hypothetical protein